MVNDRKQLWFVKLLLLFDAYTKRDYLVKKVAFIKYMDYSHFLNDIYQTLGWTIVQRSRAR